MSVIWVLFVVAVAVTVTVTVATVYRPIEPYYDIAPYSLHWNMFKCAKPECVVRESYDCYKWCNDWETSKSRTGEEAGTFGAAENCRMRCLDYADEMFDSLKYQKYTLPTSSFTSS